MTYLIEPIVFGQGSSGHRCIVCEADDYDGTLRHKRGCDYVTSDVKRVRDGSWSPTPEAPWTGPGPRGGQGEGMYYDYGQGGS